MSQPLDITTLCSEPVDVLPALLDKDFPWQLQADPVVGEHCWSLVVDSDSPWPSLGRPVLITGSQGGYVRYDMSHFKANVLPLESFKRLYRRVPQ